MVKISRSACLQGRKIYINLENLNNGMMINITSESISKDRAIGRWAWKANCGARG